MRKNGYYIHLLILFAVLVGGQNAPEVRAQSVELIDSKTGKPVEKEKLPKFVSVGHFDGFIKDTKIRFFTDTFVTPDDWLLRKSVYYGDSISEIKKYFERQISDAPKIIESGKVRKDNLETFERVVSRTRSESADSYDIFLYDGGKFFIIISAAELDLALEFEKRMTFKK